MGLFPQGWGTADIGPDFAFRISCSIYVNGGVGISILDNHEVLKAPKGLFYLLGIRTILKIYSKGVKEGILVIILIFLQE